MPLLSIESCLRSYNIGNVGLFDCIGMAYKLISVRFVKKWMNERNIMLDDHFLFQDAADPGLEIFLKRVLLLGFHCYIPNDIGHNRTTTKYEPNVVIASMFCS